VATAEADFSPPSTWSCAGILRRQRLDPPQPLRQCLRRPPLMSQTHNSPADDLLEICTCPTSTSSNVSPSQAEAPGTISRARASTKQMT
jgi:hypothetical protein